jgi:hypothetical protein
MKSRLFQGITAFCALFALTACGQADKTVVFNPVSGLIAYDGGQIMKGYLIGGQNGVFRNLWQQSMIVQTTLSAWINDRSHVVISPEAQFVFANPKQQRDYLNLVPNFSFYFNAGYFSYCWGGKENPWFQVGAGYFPEKYNPDVRDLGEYLFRTGTYPGYLINYFDMPFARLLGGFAKARLLDNTLKADVLLTSEYTFYPMEDYSPSIIVSYTVKKLIDIGAGIKWAHLLANNQKYNENSSTDPQYDMAYFRTQADSIANDTSWYTFRGTKLMGRVTIDPKALFSSSLFGSEDLKIYGEACVTALENQGPKEPFTMPGKPSYNTISERTPVAVGINLPAFGLLNVLSIEAERYSAPFFNDYMNVYGSGKPFPYVYATMPYGDDIPNNVEKWHWSLYARKSFDNGFGVVAQAARDHIRCISRSISTFQNSREALFKQGDWAYTIRLMYLF